MPVFLSNLQNKLFGEHLEFRVRLFNILACAGLSICIISGIVGEIIDAGTINLLICTFIAVLSVSLLWYSSTSGNYQRCYMITVIVVFFILFPILFITAGGYYSGMPVFFIFGLLFTVFMLEGIRMLLFTSALLILYTSLFIFAYIFPERITYFSSDLEMIVDKVVSFVVISLALGTTLSLHLRLYKNQKIELEASRKRAEELARMNGELFAAMSHEMRTPLTVMSAYAQFAVEQIKESGANEQTFDDLEMISNEAKRLSKMADGTLKVLLSTTETCEHDGREITAVDVGDLAKRLVLLMQPVAARKGQELSVCLAENIPEIRADLGELTQLLWNILQNALTHSQSYIRLSVAAEDNGVTVKVEDDGKGIEPELLPHVFEWGVSGNEDGTGVGLSICRDVVQRHNGDISVESEVGKGTCVMLSLIGRTVEQ